MNVSQTSSLQRPLFTEYQVIIKVQRRQILKRLQNKRRHQQNIYKLLMMNNHTLNISR